MDDSTPDPESKLDEALEESFPASDPAANTVETGVRVGAVPPGLIDSVTDNAARCRFELPVEGQTAFLAYERTSDALTLIHTEVPPPLRGRHLGEALVEAALRAARSAGLRVVMVCPFARAYQRRHPS